MCNLYTKFVRFLEICKHFSNGLVTEKGNILRLGPVPRFSDLEVIALSMAAESEGIDSENWLFESKLQECPGKLPNLISRRQFHDRRKSVSNLLEEIRSRMAKEMDGGEDFFCIDSKPIEVFRVSRGKRCKMGTNGDYTQAPDFGYCASQGIYFFGYKLHALCGLSGVVHSYELSKASAHDINYLKAKRTKTRSNSLCQYGQERTCPSASHGDVRIFRNAERTLWTQADKRKNQENGNLDRFLRHPHGKCSPAGKENSRRRTNPGSLTNRLSTVGHHVGTTVPIRHENRLKK